MIESKTSHIIKLILKVAFNKFENHSPKKLKAFQKAQKH